MVTTCGAALTKSLWVTETVFVTPAAVAWTIICAVPVASVCVRMLSTTTDANDSGVLLFLSRTVTRIVACGTAVSENGIDAIGFV